MQLFMTQTLLDQRARPLRDLRISVTDRCNMRCTYCMPRAHFDHHTYLKRTQILSFEEIVRLTSIFVGLGVEKVRLTGGEPLVRQQLEQLISPLANLSKSVDLALTTNAVLLAQKAKQLKQAGLSRLSISLDALDQVVFSQMSDTNIAVETVLKGIQVAQDVGFEIIKVNMVVKNGVNTQQIIPMAEHFRHSGIILRFIEFMDVGSTNGWSQQGYLPSKKILDLLNQHYPLHSLNAHYEGEVAERWAYDDGAGEIGFISSVSQAFCQSCSRIRLSADGKLFNCLFAQQGFDIKTPLRDGGSDAELSALITNYWQNRVDNYSEQRQQLQGQKKIEMSYIGG